MTEPIHKLAVIVFTDIVGFTKLTASNQQKASDLLDLHREELLPFVKAYLGKEESPLLYGSYLVIIREKILLRFPLNIS